MGLRWKIGVIVVIGLVVTLLGQAFFGWPIPYITDLVP
jgi:hypothetical protein